jgi:hypothetical protein
MINDVEPGETSPSAWGTFFTILGMIIIPLLIYIIRVTRTQIITYPFYIVAIFFVPVGIGVIILSIVIAAIYTISRKYGFLKPRDTREVFLLVATVCAIIVAQLGPVLPTNEQVFFYQHKDEFLHQVAFIKQGNPLRQYNQLAVQTEEPFDVIIFSYTAEYYKSAYAYVYAQNYSDLATIITCAANSQGSGGIGEIYATLDTNWYLCYRVGD